MCSIFNQNCDDSIIIRLHKLSHHIYNKQNELLSFHDITVQQFRVLKFILLNKENQNISQKDIEKHMNIKGSSVSSMIKTMIEKELIVKKQNLDDARFYDLDITEKGVKLLKISENIFQEFNKKITGNISEKDMEFTKNILNILESNINK